MQRSGRLVGWAPGQNGDHALREGQGGRRSSRELTARQAFHHAQGAWRGAGVLQTYGNQLAFELNRHRSLRIGECVLKHLDRVGPTEQRRMSLRKFRRELRPTGLVHGDRQCLF